MRTGCFLKTLDCWTDVLSNVISNYINMQAINGKKSLIVSGLFYWYYQAISWSYEGHFFLYVWLLFIVKITWDLYSFELSLHAVFPKLLL